MLIANTIYNKYEDMKKETVQFSITHAILKDQNAISIDWTKTSLQALL